MIPNTELENGKVELIREILDINDMHDIDLLKEYNKELTDSLSIQEVASGMESTDWKLFPLYK